VDPFIGNGLFRSMIVEQSIPFKYALRHGTDDGAAERPAGLGGPQRPRDLGVGLTALLG
jgi:hypothetical protein